MVGKDQLQHGPAGIDRPDAVSADLHAVGGFRATGRRQVTTPLHLHHTNAAPAGLVFNAQIVKLHVTERGNSNTNTFSRLQNGGPFHHHNRLIVNCQIYHIHSKKILWVRIPGWHRIYTSQNRLRI